MMTACAFAVLAAVTAGWENISEGRRPFPPTPLLWSADFSQPGNFTWEFREGAAGSVKITPAGACIVKSNDV